jgi:dihydrofolate synthase/folylpolyglutamate synthase
VKREEEDPEIGNNALFQAQADRVYAELLARVGEANPQPRLEPTRRVAELLGDPQRSYPVIHITGTNGKTSTARIAESILRAHGLRTGLMTSPHLVRMNERIVIDGEPIGNEAFAANWDDIQPYVRMIDAELEAAGELPITFFEALTLLAFACFADAPVDVVVLEVGMGGEWDSTNVADGQVAVFTPIDLDHTHRLGTTIAQIATTKAGIIKPAASVVSAHQPPEALAAIQRAVELTESSFVIEGEGFGLESTTIAVGGQVIDVRGIAGRYRDLFLPMFGDHQAQNTAVAIAAVESLLGAGTQAIDHDVLGCRFWARTRLCSSMQHITRTVQGRLPQRLAHILTSRSWLSSWAFSKTRMPAGLWTRSFRTQHAFTSPSRTPIGPFLQLRSPNR